MLQHFLQKKPTTLLQSVQQAPQYFTNTSHNLTNTTFEVLHKTKLYNTQQHNTKLYTKKRYATSNIFTQLFKTL